MLTDLMKDPYDVYLKFALGYSPSFESTSECLLGAALGQQYHDAKKTVKGAELLTRIQLMERIREMNGNTEEKFQFRFTHRKRGSDDLVGVLPDPDPGFVTYAYQAPDKGGQTMRARISDFNKGFIKL